MTISDDEALKYLYRVAQGPYRPSIYNTTSRKFTVDPMLVPQAREFIADPMLVPPPGIEPGSKDFQSSAMTTFAKAA